MRNLSPIDAAYLAGVFDCRGSLSIVRMPGGRGSMYSLDLSVASINRPLIAKLDSILEHSTLSGGHNGHDLKMVRVKARAQEFLLKQLLPYLRVRRKQARVGILFRKAFRSTGKPRRIRRAIKDASYRVMRLLNLSRHAQ